MIQQIDGWLIDRLESVCHRIQRWTGKTNFFLMMLVGVFALPMFIAFFFYCIRWRTNSMSEDLLLFIIIIYFSSIHRWRRREYNRYTKMSAGLIGQYRSGWHPDIRMATILFCFVITPCIAIHLDLALRLKALDKFPMAEIGIPFGIMFTIMCLYLFACDPLPPKYEMRRELGLPVRIRI